MNNRSQSSSALNKLQKWLNRDNLSSDNSELDVSTSDPTLNKSKNFNHQDSILSHDSFESLESIELNMANAVSDALKDIQTFNGKLNDVKKFLSSCRSGYEFIDSTKEIHSHNRLIAYQNLPTIIQTVL